MDKLGEGGMGVVYKALDTRLDRIVALKILNSELSGDADRRARFERESRAVSALNHPHIVTLYDVDAVDGCQFFTMEYVAGNSLAQLIRQRCVHLRDALDYAAQVADALSAAHTAGIVHRDVKPANLLVTETGITKVLDFGLAKLANPTKMHFDESTLTASPTQFGALMGTFAYMSPEQAQAKAVDARSDIFSFGVTLYELVTFQRPFVADSDTGTLAAIIHQPPRSLDSFELPTDLKKIINRCLQKEPARRFQSAADIKVELLEVRDSLASPTASPSLAKRSSEKRTSNWYWAAVAIICIGSCVWYLKKQTPDAPASLQSVPITAFRGYER